MNSLFDLIDLAEQEKIIQEQPKEIVYQEHSNTTFLPNLAEWEESANVPGLFECKVIGYIPQNLYAPLERRNCIQFSEDWHVQQAQWTAYVWAISKSISNEDITTHWDRACDKFEAAKTERKPMQLLISKSVCEQFVDLEVIEYLPAHKGGVSND